MRYPIKPLILPIIMVCLGYWNTNMSHAKQMHQDMLEMKLAKLEGLTGGRIGLSAVDTANNNQLSYRANERFPTGCTSKVIGVAAILQKSMRDSALANENVIYSKHDLTNWSPITKQHLAQGMTIEKLCQAAISYSDNTAMNLLVKRLGGPKAMTAFARSINDDVFRQDNWWPKEADSGGAGNLNDTSTPFAMQNSLQRLAFDNILSKKKRQQLISWLKSNTTGDDRIRAGVPNGWVVADKTGSGSSYGTTNDIGIIWPPHCAPLVVAIYYTHNDKRAPIRNEIVALTTRIVLNEFAKTTKCSDLKMISA